MIKKVEFEKSIVRLFREIVFLFESSSEITFIFSVHKYLALFYSLNTNNWYQSYFLEGSVGLVECTNGRRIKFFSNGTTCLRWRQLSKVDCSYGDLPRSIGFMGSCRRGL